MANTIKIRRSAVQGAVPTTGQLQLGELALNTYDGKLYTKKDNGTASIVELSGGGGGGTYTSSSTPPSSPSSGDRWFDLNSGIEYVYVNDGNSSAWVEMGQSGIAYGSVSTNNRLLGRSSSGAGAIEEIIVGTGLSLSAGTLSTTSGGISDGDKGDITVSSSGATWTIDNGVVTTAKIANPGTYKVLSNNGAGLAFNDSLVLRGPMEVYQYPTTLSPSPSHKSEVELSASGLQIGYGYTSFSSSTSSFGHYFYHYDCSDGFFPTTPAEQQGYRCGDLQGTTVLGFNSNVSVGGSSSTPHLATRLSFKGAGSAPSYFSGAIGSAGGVHASSRSGITLWDDNNSNNILLRPPANADLTANYTLTLPNSAGSSNQVLSTNGSGTLSWATNLKDIKSTVIESPTGSEDIILFFTTESRTLTEIRSVLIGGTSVTFTINYGTDVSTAGTQTTSSSIVCNSTTTGVSTTAFSNATIPANNYVWLLTSAVSGTVNSLHISLIF